MVFFSDFWKRIGGETAKRRKSHRSYGVIVPHYPNSRRLIWFSWYYLAPRVYKLFPDLAKGEILNNWRIKNLVTYFKTSQGETACRDHQSRGDILDGTKQYFCRLVHILSLFLSLWWYFIRPEVPSSKIRRIEKWKKREKKNEKRNGWSFICFPWASERDDIFVPRPR